MSRKLANISTRVETTGQASVWGVTPLAVDVIANTSTETPLASYFPLTRLGRPISDNTQILNGFGGAIRFELQGIISTDAVPGTLTFNARFGARQNEIGGAQGAVVGTVVFTPPASLSNAPFTIRGLCTTRTFVPVNNYTKAKLEADILLADASNNLKMYGMRSSGTGIAGYSADVDVNSVALVFQLSAKWQTASAANSLQISQHLYENVGSQI